VHSCRTHSRSAHPIIFASPSTYMTPCTALALHVRLCKFWLIVLRCLDMLFGCWKMLFGKASCSIPMLLLYNMDTTFYGSRVRAPFPLVLWTFRPDLTRTLLSVDCFPISKPMHAHIMYVNLYSEKLLVIRCAATCQKNSNAAFFGAVSLLTKFPNRVTSPRALFPMSACLLVCSITDLAPTESASHRLFCPPCLVS
jgi:hypothetical protein